MSCLAICRSSLRRGSDGDAGAGADAAVVPFDGMQSSDFVVIAGPSRSGTCAASEGDGVGIRLASTLAADLIRPVGIALSLVPRGSELSSPFCGSVRRLAQLLLCLVVVAVALARPLCAQEVHPGVVIHQLTRDGKSYTERGASFAPRGEQVAFYKQVTESDRQLWLMKDDGSDPRPVSAVGYPMVSGWSPDGARIAYVFANKDKEKSDASICVHNVATGETKKIAGGYRRGYFGDGENAPPVWSPDGEYFAYHIVDQITGISHLWTFRAADGEARRVSANLPGTTCWDLTATWSPDSEWIAFIAYTNTRAREEWSGMEVWKCHPDGSGLTQLTNDGFQSGDPAWSPQADWLLHHSEVGRTPAEQRAGWNWDIWKLSPDGSDAEAVTEGSTVGRSGRWSYVHVKWLPDGSGAYFHGWRRDEFGRGTVVFLCDADGENVRPVMGPPGDYRNVDGYRKWASPDSKKLMRHAVEYTPRGEGDNRHWEDVDDIVQIYDIASGTLTNLVSSRRDEAPYRIFPDSESWAPDSRRILFTQGKVISWQQEQYESDLYLLELPPDETDQATLKGAAAAQPEDALGLQPDDALAETPPPYEQAAVELICPKYLTVQQVLDCLPDAERAFVQTSPERNLLVVNGPPGVSQRIRDYIAPIDTSAPQVTLDVLVMEMSKTASRELGLDWLYQEGHVGGQLPLGEFGPGEIFYRGVEALEEEFFVSLSLLEQTGEVTIRANPRLVALSGSTATMNVRRTKYYFYTQGYDQYGRPYLQQSDISADITGKVTPQVLGGGNILVDVEVSVGNFTFTSTSSLPDVTTRQASTRVILRGGETITLGGLILSQNTRSISKTPILGDLPVIGQLFRSTHEQSEDNVLTILITPRLGLEPGHQDTSLE